MDKITKEEMVEILKETIYYLEINNKSSYDIPEYERLDNKDYETIAEDMIYYINKPKK